MPTKFLLLDEKQEDREVEGGGEDGGSSFFRYGVGTQLMLATVSSSARALLEDSARRCLNEEEMEALTHRLQEVGDLYRLYSMGIFVAATAFYTVL